jgi:cytidylate kinase
MTPNNSVEWLAAALDLNCRDLLRKRRAAEGFPESVPPPFTVALSRDAGAGGTEVARAVGERLGWPVYDRELLQRVAEGMGLRPEVLEKVDERHKGWLQRCLEYFVASPPVAGDAYACRLAEALLSLAARGECVIVGRGAAQVLPAESTLRVRLVGSFPARVLAVQRRHGASAEEAERRVAATDAERRRFVQEYFHKDPSDAGLYDLVLNSTRFTAGQCVDFIVEALHRLQEAAAEKRAAPAA